MERAPQGRSRKTKKLVTGEEYTPLADGHHQNSDVHHIQELKDPGTWCDTPAGLSSSR
jgi:hypothetical protein